MVIKNKLMYLLVGLLDWGDESDQVGVKASKLVEVLLCFLAEVSSLRTRSPNAAEPKAKEMGSMNSEQ